MTAEGEFELEPDPPAAPVVPAPQPAPAPRIPLAPRMASIRRMEAEQAEQASETGLFSRLDPRFRRRLKRVVPAMAVLFLIVGWLFVGAGLWAFVLAGAGVGAFSAYKRPEEAVLGSVAGVAGYGATAVAAHGLPLGIGTVFVVGICGGLGALAAINDRLAGSGP